jgi:flagellar basal-body rod protein FlgF
MKADLISYSAQKNLFQRLEILANNTANANTDGFKSDFAVYLKQVNKINGHNNPIPSMKQATDMQAGALKPTGRQLDAAINGEGFFQVETPLGPRYTRAGSFLVNSEGALVTKEGYTIVGDGGPIVLTDADHQIKIGEDGSISSLRNGAEEPVGKLGIFKFSDISSLQKVGNSLFKTEEAPTLAESVIDFKVAQGMLETSNTNQVQQMTEMIDISRSVQTFAKITQDQHQLIRSAVQRLASKS